MSQQSWKSFLDTGNGGQVAGAPFISCTSRKGWVTGVIAAPEAMYHPCISVRIPCGHERGLPPFDYRRVGQPARSRIYQTPFFDMLPPPLSPSAIHNQFRVFAPERLGDMATPANRPMGRKQLGKLLRLEFVPLGCLVIRPQQGWDMVEMMERSEALAAVHTALSLIPVGNNVPQ